MLKSLLGTRSIRSRPSILWHWHLEPPRPASVSVWQITSGRREPREGQSLPEGASVDYPILDLGNSFPRIGKRQAAAEHFAIAITMYREMDMRYWLEQAEAGRDT